MKDGRHRQGNVWPLHCESVGKAFVAFHHHLDYSNNHYLDQWAEKNHCSFIIEKGWECIGQKRQGKIIRTSEMELLEEERWKMNFKNKLMNEYGNSRRARKRLSCTIKHCFIIRHL